MATIKKKLQLPRLPNFLRVEGMEGTVDVAELDDETIMELGKEWTMSLIQHAANRRKNQEDQ